MSATKKAKINNINTMENDNNDHNTNNNNNNMDEEEDVVVVVPSLPEDILKFLIKLLANDILSLSSFSLMGKAPRKWANVILKKRLYIYATKKYGIKAPLVRAAALGKLSDCKAMVNIGNYNINKRNKFGFTALISASTKDHDDVVRYFLSLPNIDINIKTEDHATALTWAIQNGNVELTKLFCERSELQNINADANDDYHFPHDILKWHPRFCSINVKAYRNNSKEIAFPLPALLMAMNYHRGHNHDLIVKYLLNKYLNCGISKKHVSDGLMMAQKNCHTHLEPSFHTVLLSFEDK